MVLDDIDSHLFRYVLKYLYTGEVCIPLFYFDEFMKFIRSLRIRNEPDVINYPSNVLFPPVLTNYGDSESENASPNYPLSSSPFVDVWSHGEDSDHTDTIPQNSFPQEILDRKSYKRKRSDTKEPEKSSFAETSLFQNLKLVQKYYELQERSQPKYLWPESEIIKPVPRTYLDSTEESEKQVHRISSSSSPWTPSVVCSLPEEPLKAEEFEMRSQKNLTRRVTSPVLSSTQIGLSVKKDLLMRVNKKSNVDDEIIRKTGSRKEPNASVSSLFGTTPLSFAPHPSLDQFQVTIKEEDETKPEPSRDAPSDEFLQSFGEVDDSSRQACQTGGQKYNREHKQYKKYSTDDLNNALEEVKNGASALQASKKYGVPSRTLYDKIKKNNISTNNPRRCHSISLFNRKRSQFSAFKDRLCASKQSKADDKTDLPSLTKRSGNSPAPMPNRYRALIPSTVESLNLESNETQYPFVSKEILDLLPKKHLGGSAKRDRNRLNRDDSYDVSVIDNEVKPTLIPLENLRVGDGNSNVVRPTDDDDYLKNSALLEDEVFSPERHHSSSPMEVLETNVETKMNLNGKSA